MNEKLRRRMRLLFLCNEYPPLPHGGIGSTIHDLATGLADRGHHCVVAGAYQQGVTPTPGNPDFRPISTPIRRSILPWRWHFVINQYYFAAKVARIIREQRIDLIEVADYEGWSAYVPKKSIPIITRIQGTLILFDHLLHRKDPCSTIIHRSERRALRNAAHWVGVSQFALDNTEQVTGIQPKGKSVIFNTIDTDLFRPMPEVPEQDSTILFVNSIGPRKGIEELIEAFPMVLRECPNARLDVIGRGDPQYIQQLQARLDSEAAARVSFKGPAERQALPKLMAAATVCCFPSKAETFGIVAAEAMACAKAVVYMKDGPGPELITDRQSGRLVDTTDPAAIAAALIELLKNPGLRRELGNNACRSAEAKFSRRDWLLQNEELYFSFVPDCKTAA